MKKYAQYLLLGVAALGLVMVTISVGRFSAVRSQAEPNTTVTPQTQGKTVPLSRQKATPIKKGVMTKQQKEHSKLLETNPDGAKLTTLAGQSPARNGLWVKEGPGIPELKTQIDPNSNAAPQSQFDVLEGLVSNADLIVVGVVRNKSSQLTESETAIFTDYDIKVDQVLKDSSESRGQPKTNIVFTHLGGAVSLDGRTISYTPPDELLLWPSGRYLLFLKVIPATGAYQLSSEYGAFQLLRGGIIPAVSTPVLPASLREKKEAQSFIKEVRALASGKPARGGENGGGK